MTPPPGQPNGAAPPEAAPPAPMPLPPPPPPVSWAEVMPLLKGERLREYKIDIETDSTLAPDPQAEQEAAVQFVSMLAEYLAMAIPAAASGQIPPDVVGQILLFVVRRFPVARDLESTLEGWVEKLSSGQAQIAAPPDPAIGIEEQKHGIEKDKMAQEGQQFDKTQAFDREQADAQRQAEAAQMKGPPFVVGQDGAPQGANDLVMGLQQEFDQEMQQVTQALTAFMQAQMQALQQIQQTQMMIIQALQQPRQKTVAVMKGADGSIVGAKVIEAPAAGPPPGGMAPQPNGGL